MTKNLKDLEPKAKEHQVLIPYYNGKEVSREAMQILFYDEIHKNWNSDSELKQLSNSIPVEKIEISDVDNKIFLITEGFTMEIKSYTYNFISLLSDKYTSMIDSDELYPLLVNFMSNSNNGKIMIDYNYHGRRPNDIDTLKERLKMIFSSITYYHGIFDYYEKHLDDENYALSAPFRITSYFTDDLSFIDDFALLHGQYVGNRLLSNLSNVVMDKDIKEYISIRINQFLSELVDGLRGIYTKAYLIANQYKEYALYEQLVKEDCKEV